MAQNIKNTGVYNALVAQLDRLARHNRQGSYRTKERYYEAFKRFCRFLADEYHLQKLTNISSKHLVAYILKLQDEGKAASTVKTDLAAIRFFHDKLSGTKYRLPANDMLGIELKRRRFGGVDRTWSSSEFNRFLALCMSEYREDYAAIACMSYYAGLRIHECCRVDWATARAALKNGAITVKGKGGKIRTVPINENICSALRERMRITPPGCMLFVPEDSPTDREIRGIQAYIASAREKIRDEGSVSPLTHHGLRHSFAANKYRELTAGGMTPMEASLEVSRLLGHERSDVTRIYLASLQKDGEPNG